MAKLLDIVVNPNEILRRRSEAVDIDKLGLPEFTELCEDMSLTMKEKDGIGLAGPQIGQNRRVIVVAGREGAVCMINPEIRKGSIKKEWGEEGCLSVPDTFGEVKRHYKVLCDFLDREGNKKTIEAKGLMARILQHEIDHLDGILFIDKARNIRKIEK